MLKITRISKIGVLLMGLFVGATTYAQIGIGTTTPAAGSILDVTSTNKGFLVPRVNITNLATIAPVTGGPTTEPFLVWNTNTSTGIGFHYWNGSNRWVPLTSAANNNSWALAGNAIIAANFLGTTNPVDLNIRTSNVQRMRVQANGQTTVGFGVGIANTGDQFSANTTTGFANNGYATTGTGTYGQTISGNGVWGQAGAGVGVRGQSNSGIASLGISTTGVGVQGQSTTRTGVLGFGSVYGTAGQISVAPGIGAFGNATTSGTGVQGQSATGDGVLGFSGGAGDGVYGQSVTGNGVVGYTNSAGNAVYAEQDGSGDAVNAVNYGTGVGVYAENFNFSNYAIHAVDGFASIFADNSSFGYDAIIADTDDNVSNSLWARNFNAIGTAVLGGVNSLSVYPTNGAGVSGSGSKLGIYGYAGAGDGIAANLGNSAGSFTLDADSNPATNTGNNATRASSILAGYDNITPDGTLGLNNSYFGGYFSGGNITGIPSYAYAGIKYNADNDGNAGTNYKIIGNGTNSTIIRDKTNTPRILFSPEAPEILFEDYGTGKLVNGVAQINIDPILKDAIYVDEKHPLKVFIQLEGECNGVFVTNKSADGFTVKELAGGTSNISFSYHLVANRADEIGSNGEIASKHVGLRFPVGPEPLKQPELAVRKDGDNMAGKDNSSKVRPERKVKTMVKVDENIKEAEAVKKEVEVETQDKEQVLDNQGTKEDIDAISKKVKVSKSGQ